MSFMIHLGYIPGELTGKKFEDFSKTAKMYQLSVMVHLIKAQVVFKNL